jgi:RimJ/RimL family protein N-acetyltransferase
MRVRLRPLSFDDVPAIAALLSDDYEGVMQTARMPWPYREADAVAFVERVVSGPESAWAIEEVASGDFTGVIGTMSGEVPEIGYWIGKPFRGRGYATEAIGLMLAQLRERGVRQVRAHVFPGNQASARALEKNGFALAGEVEQDIPLRGGLRRLHVFVRELDALEPT